MYELKEYSLFDGDDDGDGKMRSLPLARIKKRAPLEFVTQSP